ncbi:MAG: undecaprenyldiphospho-muramoylpentapeptide beta-N-acetylglucosaminyltransferase [Steroidobacteraceae bacterium]|nr:undecaprenyldiphospho-muramoylpentapeptide beta-N-acetylglucosaminyltransferase [Steroidobacteraceae bacterium]
MTAPVLIMAGGTGGHVFPALAVARALREQRREVVWLGTRRGIESRLVPAAGIPVEWIEIEGLRGSGAGRWLAAPVRLARALLQALAVLRRLRPGVVLGCGGFVSGPGGLAAWLTRTPLVIHEQNAVAGMTNRWLSRLAHTVAEAFEGSFGAGRPTVVTGNPVRREIESLPAPAERFAGRSGPLRLFVFGGSQGAAALNRIVPQALARLPADERPAVLHQAGERGAGETAARYRELGVEADVRAFVDDMAGAYAQADLVISRAGALTVSELAAAGLGAVLVPFPAAVDDHQTRNAGRLVEAGAAVACAESALTPESLAGELRRLLGGGRAPLLAMAEAARSLAVTDVGARLAALCLAAEAGR